MIMLSFYFYDSIDSLATRVEFGSGQPEEVLEWLKNLILTAIDHVER